MWPADREQARSDVSFAQQSKAPPRWEAKGNSQSIQVQEAVSGDRADSAEAQIFRVSACLSRQGWKKNLGPIV